MPITPTYPGVYIEELPSDVRTIMPVATSNTAFIGRTLRGPVNEPVVVTSEADFVRRFGDRWIKSPMTFAVRDYFLNGGFKAIIVRIVGDGALNATISLNDDGLTLHARYPGEWGNLLRVFVYHINGDTDHYNLIVRDPATRTEEQYLKVHKGSGEPRCLDRLLENSQLIKVDGVLPETLPPAHTEIPYGVDPFGPADTDTDLQEGIHFAGTDGAGLDGDPPVGTDYTDSGVGINALGKLETDIFNLLYIPPVDFDTDITDLTDSVLDKALKLCVDKRAILLVDAPSSWGSVDKAATEMANLGAIGLGDGNGRNAAMYFPWIRRPNPLLGNQVMNFPPGGAVAGIIARTDRQRGVWKAPAGIDASLSGAPELSLSMTDPECGRLNPLGLNCLRRFPIIGRVVWGARTLRGADQLVDQWKYLPVRRTALYIEESLNQGLKWVVFEPNDESLWAQIRLNVGAFMHNLFRQGAFQGTTPRDAYFVKCDKETTTQNDIDQGKVNILVGFAPLKPAEFVIIQITQKTAEVQT